MLHTRAKKGKATIDVPQLPIPTLTPCPRDPPRHIPEIPSPPGEDLVDARSHRREAKGKQKGMRLVMKELEMSNIRIFLALLHLLLHSLPLHSLLLAQLVYKPQRNQHPGAQQSQT